MVLSNTSFFSAIGDTSKLFVFSLWDNLANNPGGVVALLTFFFFGVEWFNKDGAIVTDNGKDDDDGNDNGDKDDDNNSDDNNDDDDAVFGRFNFTVFFYLPFLTFFVGVTIKGDGLHFLGVLASSGVFFFVFLAMVGWLIWFRFGIMCFFW